jgi:hypothetical protein
MKNLKQHIQDLHGKSFSHHTADHSFTLKKMKDGDEHDYGIYSSSGKFMGSVGSSNAKSVMNILKSKGYNLDKK